jgi:hypothetical protein
MNDTTTIERATIEREYVVIHGLAPSHLLGQGDESDETLRQYVGGIVYGTPRRIFGTLLATGKFVALVEYDYGTPWAKATVERLGSFSYGGSYALDSTVAWESFGTWVGHYSGCTAGIAVGV